jgi:hypothetical protein
LNPVGHRSHDPAVFKRTSLLRRRKKRVNASPPTTVLCLENTLKLAPLSQKRGPQREVAALGDALIHLHPLSPRSGGCQIGKDQRVVRAHAAGGNPVIASPKAREYSGLIATGNNPDDAAGMI